MEKISTKEQSQSQRNPDLRLKDALAVRQSSRCLDVMSRQWEMLNGQWQTMRHQWTKMNQALIEAKNRLSASQASADAARTAANTASDTAISQLRAYLTVYQVGMMGLTDSTRLE